MGVTKSDQLHYRMNPKNTTHTRCVYTVSIKYASPAQKIYNNKSYIFMNINTKLFTQQHFNKNYIMYICLNVPHIFKGHLNS